MSGNAYEIFSDENVGGKDSLNKTVSELFLFGFSSRFLDATKFGEALILFRTRHELIAVIGNTLTRVERAHTEIARYLSLHFN